MNPFTLALTGLEEDDVADFRRVFGKLRSSLDADWRLTDGYEATLTVIDIDSIHGHMDWLKAVGAGLRTAVYTGAQYAKESDLCLFKPLAAENLAEILNAVAAEHGVDGAVAAHDKPVAPPAAPKPRLQPKPEPLPAVVETIAPVQAVAAEPPAPLSGVQVATLEPLPVAPAVEAEPVSAPASEPVPEPAAPATVGAALRNGSITVPSRIVLGENTWVLDPERDGYHGPATLKPLQPAMDSPLDALAPVDVVALEQARRTPAQPMARLRWYAGLLISPGRLHDGLATDGRYMLARWPQIEREFPRHFRIATAMMKQPGTLEEIAAASGAPLADVADFVNASDAVGIVVVSGDALEASEAPRTGGMMSRIRKPFGR